MEDKIKEEVNIKLAAMIEALGDTHPIVATMALAAVVGSVASANVGAGFSPEETIKQIVDGAEALLEDLGDLEVMKVSVLPNVSDKGKA